MWRGGERGWVAEEAVPKDIHTDQWDPKKDSDSTEKGKS